MSDNNFVKMAQINVSDHIEKKNGLSYLSWPFAVAELMKADPAANWLFHDPIRFGETMMVSCTVTAFGKPVTMHLPVMDHRNQAIKNPDAFAVNKNMMRCLVKAIACHGLGLYIYAGEDLPEGEGKKSVELVESRKKISTSYAETLTEERKAELSAKADEVSIIWETDQDFAVNQYVTFRDSLDTDEQAAFKHFLDEVNPKLRNGLLKHYKAMNEQAA